MVDIEILMTLVALANLLDEYFTKWGVNPAPCYTQAQLVAWGVDRSLITEDEAKKLTA